MELFTTDSLKYNQYTMKHSTLAQKMLLFCFISRFILTEGRWTSSENDQFKEPMVSSFVDSPPSDTEFSYPEIVNFFNIGKEGLFDPVYNLKRPIDFDFSDPRLYTMRQKRTRIDHKKIGPPLDDHSINRFFEETEEFALNWTSCKEFGVGAYFHPQEVVNIEWIPFYIWSLRMSEAVPHKFLVPTKKLVEQFRTQYDRFLSEPVNWKAPKLLLIENDEKETLLIADGRSGLFKGIMKADLHPTKHKSEIPVSHRMLKIEAPYLLMTSCDFEFAAAMAPIGTEPDTDEEKTREGEKLKFRGNGMPVSRSPMAEIIKRERRLWRKEALERATLRNFRK